MIFGSYLQKRVFTDLINNYRISVANNENSVLTDSAADMKVVNWNEELQVLAVYSIELRSMQSPKFCISTYRYPNVTRFNRYYNTTTTQSAESLMKLFHQDMVDTIEKKVQYKNRRVERFSAYVDSKFEAIGCAFAEYTIPDEKQYHNHKIFVVECYLNQATGRNFNDIFLPGATCSRCDCIEICSEEFVGLCEYRQVRGETIYCKGDVTPNSYQITDKSFNSTLKCQINSMVDALYSHFYLIYTFIFVSFLSYLIFFVYFKYL